MSRRVKPSRGSHAAVAQVVGEGGTVDSVSRSDLGWLPNKSESGHWEERVSLM